MKKLVFLIFFAWGSGVWAATDVVVSHAIALRGTPKYAEGFTHFAYTNPNAPKGGSLTVAAIGTYDNFNRYAQQGLAAAGSGDLYDSLMVSSDDEISVYYGLVAEKIEYSDDFTWIVFHLRPEARFYDGKPITAEDVVFTFNKFIKEGVPQFKRSYQDITKVEALDKQRVRFSLEKGNKELLAGVGRLPILPKHFWENHNFSKPMTEIPLGSAVYRVKDYKVGQYVTYERVKDYWGADLPVNKGQYNFDTIRYDYYRDETVALEAFKAGELDFRQENIAKQWVTLYQGPNFDNGSIVKAEIAHQIPQPMQGFVFNTKKEIFKDAKVREALSYAMDFEWMNKNLFYNQYRRTRSYFQNTEYEALGLPSPGELKILEPLRDKIPERVFTEEYQPPKTEGTGNIRKNIRAALRLLKPAGWEVKNKVLTNVKTGKPFEFEVLIYSPSTERILVPMQNNLKRLGITMNIRQVDTTRYTFRLRERDYDMVSSGYSANPYPSPNLKLAWRSNYLDSTYNTAGVEDPAIDAIIDGIEASQQNAETLLSYGRALDRILQWHFFVIPQWHFSKFRVAYWNKFTRPAVRPKYALGVDTWWVDPQKEKKLPKRNVSQ